MSRITTHILDTSTGKPATGVMVILFQQQTGAWDRIAQGITNSNGRITDFGGDTTLLEAGTYRLDFQTAEYFSRSGVAGFYPFVQITFEINAADHYHVPLLLNPFGYTTYRGS